MQIQIGWLLKKPTDLDLHCLQRQCISGFSRTRVKQIENLEQSVVKTMRVGVGVRFYIDFIGTSASPKDMSYHLIVFINMYNLN